MINSKVVFVVRYIAYHFINYLGDGIVRWQHGTESAQHSLVYEIFSSFVSIFYRFMFAYKRLCTHGAALRFYCCPARLSFATHV